MEPLSSTPCPLCCSHSATSVTRADALDHMRGHAFERAWPTLRTLTSALGPDLLPPADRPPLPAEDDDEKVLADEEGAAVAFHRGIHLAHLPSTEPMARLALLVDWVADGRRLCPPSFRDEEGERAEESKAKATVAASATAIQAFKTLCARLGKCHPAAGRDGGEPAIQPSRARWLAWVHFNEHWALAVLRKFFYSAELGAETVALWALDGVPPSDAMAPLLRRKLLAELQTAGEKCGDDCRENPPPTQQDEAKARRRAKLARRKARAGDAEARSAATSSWSAEMLSLSSFMREGLPKMSSKAPEGARLEHCLAFVQRASSLVEPAKLERFLAAPFVPEDAVAMLDSAKKGMADFEAFLSYSLALCCSLIQKNYPKAKLDSATLLAWAVEGPPPLPRKAKAAPKPAKGSPRAEEAPSEEASPPPQSQPLRKPRVLEEPAKEEPADDTEWETVAKRGGGKSSKKKARVAPPKAVRRSSPRISPAPSPPPPPPGLSDKPAPRLPLLEHLGYDDELGEPLGLGPALRSLTLTARLARRHGFLSLQ